MFGNLKVIRGGSEIPLGIKKSVVTIGNFDGVHLGHQAILSTLKQKAKEHQCPSILYTFRPHPQVALRPEKNLELLMTYDEKLECLSEQGIDYVIEEPFSREFSTTEPNQFFRDVLLRKLQAKAIVVGYDFSFGKGRAGNLELLEKACADAGVEFFVVPPHREGDQICSSTQIRKCLMTSEIRQAKKMLGKPFFYQGVVMKGEARGRKLGFPTANLKPEEKLILPYGVYATKTKIKDYVGGSYPKDQEWMSVTNVGVRPTFQSGSDPMVLIETHLLDFDADLYGHPIQVLFYEKIREEKKFSGIDELKEQIGRDLQTTRKFFS